MESNRQRIAKNTMMLYIRMLLIMVVSLYTSKLVLQALGASDYGIYNVVGGIVASLSFFSGALASANSRYITFALGQNKLDELKIVFKTLKTIQLFFAIIILFLSETIGLWFVCKQLVIPVERLTVTIWIYHFSVISFVVSILSVPYNAIIISYEKMSAFAYISIFEVLAKLLLVLTLTFLPWDKLFLYGLFLLIIQIAVRIIYMKYCKAKFPESKTGYGWNVEKGKEMLAYSGWCSYGHIAVVGYTHGLNILLNLFFGPVVNAARAIAVQVQGAIVGFCNNIQTAIDPQIIKSYASGNFSEMHKLMVLSSKLSYYIMFVLAVPIILNTNYILHIWLGDVPGYTVPFVRITLAIGVLSAVRDPVMCAIHATGEIKKAHFIEGVLLLMIIPISYIDLKFYNGTPLSVFYVYFLVELLTQTVRIYLILPKVGMSYLFYIREIVFPLICATSISSLVFLLRVKDSDFVAFLWTTMFSLLYVIVIVYLFGLKKEERSQILLYIKNKRNRLYES